MTNYEKYKELIAKFILYGCYKYGNAKCEDCPFDEFCRAVPPGDALKWLDSEYVPPTELTKEERIILESIKDKFNWIARDDDNGLYVYKDKPSREDGFWYGNATGFNSFNHMFKFVKMDDEEPYNIGGLLKND